jgi:hypothetical protein
LTFGGAAMFWSGGLSSPCGGGSLDSLKGGTFTELSSGVGGTVGDEAEHATIPSPSAAHVFLSANMFRAECMGGSMRTTVDPTA